MVGVVKLNPILNSSCGYNMLKWLRILILNSLDLKWLRNVIFNIPDVHFWLCPDFFANALFHILGNIYNYEWSLCTGPVLVGIWVLTQVISGHRLLLADSKYFIHMIISFSRLMVAPAKILLFDARRTWMLKYRGLCVILSLFYNVRVTYYKV